jgi:chromosome segregation ATPase
MAAAPGRTRCVTCGKDNKATLRCGGCLQEYCYSHLTDHRQELGKQLDEIEVTRDLFRQTLTQQTAESEKHALIQQINDWERDSIKQIRCTAEEARQTLLQHTIDHVKQIEVDLNQLTDQLRQSREDNDFFETDLHHWNEELKRLSKELTQPTNINLRRDTTSFINKISVVTGTCKCINRS